MDIGEVKKLELDPNKKYVISCGYDNVPTGDWFTLAEKFGHALNDIGIKNVVLVPPDYIHRVVEE